MNGMKKYATDRVYEDLFNMLVGGDYAPGDKIPSENELKQRFNVSRNTIRAALNRMNVLGIIDTRQGDGTYLKGLGTNMYLNELVPSMLANAGDLIGLLHFRRGIEVSSARLAAINATEEDLRDMEEYFAFLRESDVNNQNFARMTSDFHKKIAAASKNLLLAETLEIITWIITARMASFLAYRPNVADSSYYHDMIYRCIRNRKPEEAAYMMSCHMDLLIETVTEYLRNDRLQGGGASPGETIRVTNIYRGSEGIGHDTDSCRNESDGADGV